MRQRQAVNRSPRVLPLGEHVRCARRTREHAARESVPSRVAAPRVAAPKSCPKMRPIVHKAGVGIARAPARHKLLVVGGHPGLRARARGRRRPARQSVARRVAAPWQGGSQSERGSKLQKVRQGRVHLLGASGWWSGTAPVIALGGRGSIGEPARAAPWQGGSQSESWEGKSQ